MSALMHQGERDGERTAGHARGIRVAALLDTAQVSGPGRQLAALAVQLMKAGVELRVITFHRDGRARSPYLDYLDAAGVRYTVIPDGGPLDARLVPRLRRVLADWKPAIVQTHGYKPTALAFALRACGARWPWVAFSHGATSENKKVKFYHWIELRLLGAADRIVVMSRQQRDALRGLGGKTRVLHNAAIPLPADPALDGAAHETSRTRHGDEFGSPLVGVVGRLSPEKGVDVFLRACRELSRRGIAFSAVVAGEGPERRSLDALRRALGLEDRVRFLGPVAAVRAMYAALDLLVIPSRSEGLPNVLLEALRADVPVVGTAVGSIPDVLDSSAAGVVVPPGDSAALANGIARGLSLKADPASRNARRAVTERFSLERRVAAHLQLYRELLEVSQLREMAR
jgi:glycosyltransferase involved in cell wall biosynthesis